jgi:hypothetical protein
MLIYLLLLDYLSMVIVFQSNNLIRANSYPQSGGELPRGSPNGGLPRGRSHDQDPLGGLPLDRPIGFYEWLTPPRIFTPQ